MEGRRRVIKEKTAIALAILQSHGGITPEGFARLLWPESDGWKRSVRAGNGSARGGGMRMAAGSYLGKLSKQGYAEKKWKSFRDSAGGWYLTKTGLEALVEYRNMTKEIR